MPTVRARVRLAAAPKRPKVSARAHNRVLDAAQKRVDLLEPRLASIIETILHKAGTQAARRFEERATRHGGVPDASLVAAGPDWSPPFPDELINVDSLVQQILDKTEPVRKALIEQTMTPALEQAGLSFDVSNPLTAKLFADTGSQVTNIAMTTRANLMDIIGKSYQNGLTIPATRDLIRQGMRSASKVRATMIARTEMARAVNGGSLIATQLVAQETGQRYDKVWHTAPGARYPRHELYPDLDGQQTSMDGTFTVGEDQLQYPGDPDGEPGETINCRCTLTYTEVQADRVPTPGAAPEPVSDVLTAPLVPLPNTQEVDDLVAALRRQADKIEPGVTPIMKAAAQQAGGKLVGLSFKQKSAKSAIRKIISDAADRGITPREDAYQVSDMLRYTAVFSPDQYLAGTQSVLDDLLSHGFKIDRIRNTWSKDVNYAGINTRILAPNGYRFELQFHTPESFNLKNTTQHVLYEKYRLLDPTSAEAQALDREMNANVRALDFPPGVEGWKYEPGTPAVAAEPEPVKAAEDTGAPRSVDIGITPFRAGEDNAVGFYDSAKYKQFITDIQSSAKAYGVKIDGIDKVTGVWEGDTEPSVSLRIHADNEIAHSKPPPIDFADANDTEKAWIQQAVTDAYARMDKAGVTQDWESGIFKGAKGQPRIIQVQHYGSDEAALQFRGDVIDINVDSSLFPPSSFKEDAADLAKGVEPKFLNADLADSLIHEYGHAAYQSLSPEQRAEWNSFWEKWPTPGSVTGYPSFYAQESASEAWSETFVALVRGYPQGAAFQEKMRPLLQDSGVLAKPEDSEAYRGQHTAPDRESGAPMYDLNSGGIYPPDVYDQKKQLHLYGQGGSPEDAALDQEAFNVINSVKGDPTAMVTVYRAVPGDVNTINPGDWVTPVKEYAEHHAEGNLGQDAEGHVVSMQVPAAQLFTDGNSIQEWGWDPPGRTAFDAESRFKAYVSNLGQAYNQDGVIMFEPNATGDSIMATFAEPLPEQKVIDAMKHAGIPGGRFTTDGRLQIIGEATEDFANQIKQLSQELGGIKLDIGEPMPLYDPMTSYTGPGSRYFKDVSGFLRNQVLPEQIRSIFQDTAAEVADSLGRPTEDITDHVQMELQKAFKDATTASIDHRELPNLVTVYGKKPEPGAVQSFFLKPQKGLQPYTVNRNDILVDMDAFRPAESPATNEVLISGDKILEPGAVEQPTNTGAYTVARGNFSMLERDSGDYRKALDAFSNPKGVTAFDTPNADAPPSVSLPRGAPITGYPTSGFGADLVKIQDMGDAFLNNKPQQDWVEAVSNDEDRTLGVDMHKVNDSMEGVISNYTTDGSHDINGILSGEITNDNAYDKLEQYDTFEDAEANAKAMQQLVDSAPPLPPGTTLYRGINPVGIDASLHDRGFAVADKAISKFMKKWKIDKLDPYSPEYEKIVESPEFQKEHEKVVKQSYEAVAKMVGDWAADRYPVGSYVAMGAPGEFESMTLNPALAAQFANTAGQPSVVFKVINAKTGAPIFPFSNFTDESEILAPPNTMYRVRSVELAKMDVGGGGNTALGKTADKVVVTLEEAPKCGVPGAPAIAASLVAATGVACTNIAQYVPDKPAATAVAGDLFPGQSEKLAEQAAAHRNAAIARYAAANHMTVEEYKAAADQVIKTYIAQHPQIRVRVSHQALDAILESGRFKSEFEIPGISGDDTEGRRLSEQNLFGYPADLAPAERPIYGYLAGTADETGQVQEYGDMIVNLNPAVNARSTFTIGDSYEAGIRHRLSPSLLGNPGIGSWDGSFDIVKAWNEGDLGKISRYVEVEIHGGLPVSDIGGVTPDEALIVSREDAARVKDAVEAITELAANYQGTQQASPQVDQAGIPLDKPPQLDYTGALLEIAKNAAFRQGALAALIARVGLRGKLADSFVDFSALTELGAGHL